MREQIKGEKRIEYLAKILYEFMTVHGVAAECTIKYDGVECDGTCLAQDFIDELGINL